MRKLVWFVTGFVLALLVGIYLLRTQYILIAVSIAAAILIILILLRKRIRFVKQAICIAVGSILSFLWLNAYDILFIDDVKQFDDQTVNAQVLITDYSEAMTNSTAVNGKIHLNGSSYNVRLYISETEPLQPGDQVAGKFKLNLTTIGAIKESSFYQAEGVFIIAHVKTLTHISKLDNIPISCYPSMLRKDILSLIDDMFPADAVGFAQALFIGDSSGITYEENSHLIGSGIRHVIAVSGLHVSILFSLIYIFAGKRRVLTAILGIPLLIAFAAIAGFTPSVVRACIMQILIILALLFKQDYDPYTALAFAVLAMLVYNPFAITSVSLQLSSCCMIGIFLFSPRINRFIQSEKCLGSGKGNNLRARLIRWIAGTVSVSLSASVMTIPLSAYYFGAVSIVGVLTNLLTLWIVSFIFYGVMLACLIGAVFPVAGHCLAWLISWLIRYVMFVSDLLGSLPISAVYTESPYILLWIIFCYVLFATFYICKKKYPFVLLSCASIGLCISIAFSWIEPKTDNYRVTILDVGQGQSILIQCDDRHYLVDCGGDSNTAVANQVVQKLKSQGIFSLDGIILTHYDYDHACAAQNIMSVIDTSALYVTNPDPDTLLDDEILKSYNGKVITVNNGIKLLLPSGFISIFGADPDKHGNESSLCVLFQSNNYDILITGDRNIDGEKDLISRYDIGKVDVLIAGHHGSDNSSSMALLSRIQPVTVVISVGADNIHGHPDQDAINRFKIFGCNILRTDLHGEIVFRG